MKPTNRTTRLKIIHFRLCKILSLVETESTTTNSMEIQDGAETTILLHISDIRTWTRPTSLGSIVSISVFTQCLKRYF